MKRVVGVVMGAALLTFAVSAQAQSLPQNFNNMFFFISGCSTYVPTTPGPGIGGVCVDTTSGGYYLWNGTAFVMGGTELLQSNAGAGQTTATTTYFTAAGNSTNATTETVAMQLPVGPNPVVVRNLSCYTSAAPGGGNSDTFTVRTATSLGGTMGNTTVTCQISGASAKTCTASSSLSAALPAGSVLDISDVTAGTPAARTIGCALQADVL